METPSHSRQREITSTLTHFRASGRSRFRRRPPASAIRAMAQEGRDVAAAVPATFLAIFRRSSREPARRSCSRRRRTGPGTSSSSAPGCRRCTARPRTRMRTRGRAPSSCRRSRSHLQQAVAAHPAVRRELVRKQRELIGRGGVVVEGRDIGTVVRPDADLKVWVQRDVGGPSIPRLAPALPPKASGPNPPHTLARGADSSPRLHSDYRALALAV